VLINSLDLLIDVAKFKRKGSLNMEYRERVIADPQIMLGKPIIKGTRITVELILQKLSQKMQIEDLLISYPNLNKEDIYAALAYSADVIGKEEMLVY
jgi:uncharacterized protein (DUF433 family)